MIEHNSSVNVKRTWCDYGRARDWADDAQGQGEEFRLLMRALPCE